MDINILLSLKVKTRMGRVQIIRDCDWSTYRLGISKLTALFSL